MSKLKTAAFFDLDGTIYDGVMVFDYVRMALLKRYLGLKELVKIPQFLSFYLLDKLSVVDRYNVNKRLYAKLKGWDQSNVLDQSRKFFKKGLQKKIFPKMYEILQNHKKEGAKVVIVTTSIKEVVQPIAEFLKVDDLIATQVESKDGKYTDKVTNLPIGKNRASIIGNYCSKNNIDPKNCYAYSDHFSDIPLMEFVGNPRAVNPDRKLRPHARKNGWKILNIRR